MQRKKVIDGIKTAKSDLEQARFDLEHAQRTGDYGKASELQYSTIPRLEKQVREIADSEDSMKSSTLLHDSALRMILPVSFPK